MARTLAFLHFILASPLPLTLTANPPSIPPYVIHIQIARVNAAPAPFTLSNPTGFLLYHTDVDPVSVLLCARKADAGGPPCVARIGSGGWGAEDHGDMMRTIVDIDPDEWGALWERRWQMDLDGIWPDRHHEDAERWARLDPLRTRAPFFADAAHAPEVLRLIAR